MRKDVAQHQREIEAIRLGLPWIGARKHQMPAQVRQQISELIDPPPPPPRPRHPEDRRPRAELARKLIKAANLPPYLSRPVRAYLQGEVGHNAPINPQAVDRMLGSVAADQAIRIELTSAGGDPWCAMECARRILQHRGVVTVSIPRYAHSAAVALVAAGDIRAASPHARFVMHRSAAQHSRFTSDVLRTIADQLDTVDNEIDTLIAVACAAPLRRIRALCVNEATLSAREARSLGLLSEITR